MLDWAAGGDGVGKHMLMCLCIKGGCYADDGRCIDMIMTAFTGVCGGLAD
jgi:hypothetical protein